jgi:hypothetical protein
MRPESGLGILIGTIDQTAKIGKKAAFIARTVATVYGDCFNVGE